MFIGTGAADINHGSPNILMTMTYSRATKQNLRPDAVEHQRVLNTQLLAKI